MRASGILLPIFSLPGKYGIGCLSDEAFKFIDFLSRAGQKYWQILPVGPTGYGDSPYQPFSSFAGNPYFISLEKLIEQGVLTSEECDAADFGEDSCVDYGKQYVSRYALLHKAYERSGFRDDPAFLEFAADNAYWLEDYAMYMAIKNALGGKSFTEWDADIRYRRPEALAFWKEKEKSEIEFVEYLQYEFTRQWFAVRNYANEHGIRIIGDIPIYVSPDGADFWAHPELFRVDEENLPSAIAGCPPDGFSADGQVWGNPLYNWEAHKAQDYDWWTRRIAKSKELYDVIRIDHFRGFDEYYAIPYGESTAVNGRWEKGPGMDLFHTLEQKLGKLDIVAEDLGYITETVKQLVKDSGFPNMKVLEFAFDSRDSSGREAYFPHNYERNCVVYTGTHDNETLKGWLSSILPSEREELKEYLDTDSDDPDELIRRSIRLAESSVADKCIIPMQDLLHLDNSARMNCPNTLGKNWAWRMSSDACPAELSEELAKVVRIYGR
ncbi:MAG: 4-alpha-glucanotransferase [Eubacterium sp.]|nr:4-alpha-glucanotransferase [Eubacterium sp.]